MYEIAGDNAIIKQGKKIKVAKVPIDCRWYERLLFGDYTRVNENLARKIPGFFDESVYLPRMLAPGAEGLELLRDGGRSSINADKHATLDMFGVKQTYVEKRKGVGSFTSDYRSQLYNEELKNYLGDEDLVIVDINFSFNRPYGVQSKDFALNELQKSWLLEKLGVKHTPVLSVFPIPKSAEKGARRITEKYIKCGENGIWGRPKTRYYQETILFPGNIRIGDTGDFSVFDSGDFVGILKELGVDLNKFSKELEKDFMNFLEITPKTLTESADGYTVLGFDNWFFSDCVLAPTGLYVTDLESVGFYKIEKNYLTSDFRSAIQYLDRFWNVMRNVAYRHLPEKNNDETIENLIDVLNKSRYLVVELKGKEQDGEVDRYLLNFRMECESGTGIDFNKYVSLESSS